jgi:hypothetical protein
MERDKIVKSGIGIIVTLLGAMWFLQGTGVLTICPILCFADCECITGGSLTWAIIGAVVFIAGLAALFLIHRRKL